MTGKIQAFRAGINLKSNIPFGRLLCNTLEVKRVTFALHQHAPRSMSENLERRGFECPKKTIRHLSRLHSEITVNASDHKVEFGERVFAQIETPVPQDVAFKAREHVEGKTFAVKFANLARKFHRPGFVEPVCHRERLRMICDGNVFVTESSSRFGHLAKSRFPIRGRRVHVQ